MEMVYIWIRNIVVYMILNTIIMNLLGNSNYKKFVSIASGMILVLIVIAPLMNLMKLDEQLDYFLLSNNLAAESSEFENQLRYVEGKYRETVMSDFKETIQQRVEEMLIEDGVYLTKFDLEIDQDVSSEQYGKIIGMDIKASYEEQQTSSAMVNQIDRIDINKIEFSEEEEMNGQQIYSPSEINTKNKLSNVYNINPSNINISIQGG